MRTLMTLLAAMVFLISCASIASHPPTTTTLDQDGFKTISQEEMSFKWKIVDEHLECIVSGPTKGWLAVGFNTKKPKMDKSNFVFGYVKEDKLYIEDHIAKGWGHQADKEQNIIESSGEENDDMTTIKFTIPLKNDAHSQDAILEADQEVYILLAMGKKDDFKSYHKKRTVIKVNL